MIGLRKLMHARRPIYMAMINVHSITNCFGCFIQDEFYFDGNDKDFMAVSQTVHTHVTIDDS